MLRVVIASEVHLFREGVASILADQDGVTVIGTADVSGARAMACELKPDIVLLDATRRESVEHAKSLAAELPDSKIVALGITETRDDILAWAAAGTAGYVRSDAAAKEVVAVLARVMRDELLCSPRTTASLYRQVALLSHEGHETTSVDVLSRRERQIALLIHRGLSNKEIARELGIEAATVKNHVHHILDKLKVRRRGEVVQRVRSSLHAFAEQVADGQRSPATAIVHARK